jgi:hypothetical protein
MSWRQIQAAVGLVVTFGWTSSRRAWWTKASTYSVRKVSVWTVSKSAAQIRGRWLRRKVRQVWLGGGSSALCVISVIEAV